MGEVIAVICLVGALYVCIFYLMRYEVKRYKATIAKEEKQTELYECLLKKTGGGLLIWS